MEVYSQIVSRIIEQQELIIGPVAVSRAEELDGLVIDWPNHTVSFKNEPKATINELVGQYKELFGQIAVETCKDAVASQLANLSADQLPSSLV